MMMAPEYVVRRSLRSVTGKVPWRRCGDGATYTLPKEDLGEVGRAGGCGRGRGTIRFTKGGDPSCIWDRDEFLEHVATKLSYC